MFKEIIAGDLPRGVFKWESVEVRRLSGNFSWFLIVFKVFEYICVTKTNHFHICNDQMLHFIPVPIK